jgi:hypothetical protein
MRINVPVLREWAAWHNREAPAVLPFTSDEFFGVFAAYNVAIWPVQIAAYVIAAMALWLIFAKHRWAGRVAGGVLALFWLWDGIAYHLLFFSKINPAAYIFGAGFILQGLLFFAHGAIADRLALRFQSGWRGVLGLALIVYAALVYEVVGHLSGHGCPRAPLFGVAPCPTVIFTFGVLLLSIRPVPVFLVAIPLIWAGIGSTAAILLGVPEDLGLVVSGLIGAVLLPSWGFRPSCKAVLS